MNCHRSLRLKLFHRTPHQSRPCRSPPRIKTPGVWSIMGWLGSCSGRSSSRWPGCVVLLGHTMEIIVSSANTGGLGRKHTHGGQARARRQSVEARRRRRHRPGVDRADHGTGLCRRVVTRAARAVAAFATLTATFIAIYGIVSALVLSQAPQPDAYATYGRSRTSIRSDAAVVEFGDHRRAARVIGADVARASRARQLGPALERSTDDRADQVVPEVPIRHARAASPRRRRHLGCCFRRAWR